GQQMGPYRLEHPLGEGGMGLVYQAIHQDTGQRVAIKVVRLRDEHLAASIRREIFALKSLAHAAVVRIVGDGMSDGQPWYAMELLDGSTLEDYIATIHEAPSAVDWRFGDARSSEATVLSDPQ